MVDDADPLRPGRINALLYRMISDAFYEFYVNVRRGTKNQCPKLHSLKNQAEIHALGYPALETYKKETADLDKQFGKENTMDPIQQYHRLHSVISLLKSIGSFSLNPRYTYAEEEEPDDWDFTAFNYDISGVDTTPEIENLSRFYYAELEKEFQDKRDIQRKKEADTRAKRTWLFYQKYREYEESDFDTNLIEDIFGITREEQRTLKHWLSELTFDGQISVLFAPAGQGKSNAGAFVVQSILIMYPRWDILTDIPFIFAPKILQSERLINFQIDRIKFVENMSEMLTESANSLLAGRIPVPILDEMDSARIKIQARMRESVSFKFYEYIERHLDTQGPLMIYHLKKDIPTELQPGGLSHQVFSVSPYTNLYEHKKSKRVISSPTYWEIMPHGMRYFPVPLTNLPYHAHGFSPFTIDVDMQWLNQQLGISTKEQAAKKILQLIPARGWEKKFRREKIEPQKA